MTEKNTILHGKRYSGEKIRGLMLKLSVNSLKIVLVCTMLLSLTACSSLFNLLLPGGSNYSGKSYTIKGKRYHIMASAKGYRERGQASWYGEPFHGRKTANGETYNMNRLSAAHKTLPLNTWVEVRNLENNKVLAVRINDRGPFVRGRIIDLSREAAKRMDMLDSGVARVSVRTITGSRASRLDAIERMLASAENMGRQQASLGSVAPSAGDQTTKSVLTVAENVSATWWLAAAENETLSTGSQASKSALGIAENMGSNWRRTTTAKSITPSAGDQQ